MISKHLFGAAAAAALGLLPAAAWAQGDANMTSNASANTAPNTAPVTPVAGNSAAGGPAAPAATDTGGDTANRGPVYLVQRGFPWGVLGLIGLIGLLPLFRRRDG
jgi:hypothetical protein